MLTFFSAPRARPRFEIQPPAQFRRLRAIPDGRRQLRGRRDPRRRGPGPTAVKVSLVPNEVELQSCTVPASLESMDYRYQCNSFASYQHNSWL